MPSHEFERAKRLLGVTVASAVLLLLAVAGVKAQEGAVTGRVTDESSLAPLAGAQIFLPGTQLGTLTDDEGNYRIPGVPAGTHELRVRLIGYKSAVRNVTVGAGQTVTADFRLSVSAVSLQEVVVTATGAQRQRELGHAVSTIDAASQVQKSDSRTITNLIQGNATGVSIRQNSGSVGTGATIKIRGNSSIGLDNTPLIYVDGVRVSNANDVSTPNFTLDVGGQQPSRLNDLNPQDIESIDVLKGPSAVTLYGTEAAAGVILITTKKGRAGQTRYDLRAGVGGNWDATHWGSRAFNPAADFASLGFGKDTVYLMDLLDGAPGIQPPFRTGLQNTYAASARGGLQDIDYYLSGQYESLQGNLAGNRVTKWNGRANLSLHPSDKVDISVSNGYVSNTTLLPQNDNNGAGYILQGSLGDPSLTPMDRVDPNSGAGPIRTCATAFEVSRAGLGPTFGAADNSLASTTAAFCGSPLGVFPSFSDVGLYHTEENVDRYTGSATVTYRPASPWTNRFTVGLDQFSDYGFFLQPVVPRLANIDPDFGRGFLQRENTNNTNLTLQATSAVDVSLTDDLASTTTVGGQYFDQRQKNVYAQGRTFPSGSPAVNNSVTNQGNDFFTEVKTLGLFGEQRFAWRDRIFLTGGIRFDDNSAFGSELGLTAYPRVSLSYILSDESWFPTVFDQFKLRGSWGESGKQPSTNSSLALLTPVSVPIADQEILGVTANRPGNDTLKPELDKEIEVGFDASVLKGRLGASFTWYRQTTKNAVVNRPLQPSLGFPNNAIVNVGAMTNTGVEASLDAVALDMPGLTWEWRVQGSTNYNKITELPAPIIFGLSGSSQRHQKGFPFGSYFSNPVTVGASGNVTIGDTAVYLGDPTPNFTGSVSSTLTLFAHVTLYGLADWETGQQIYSDNLRFMCVSGGDCAELWQRKANGDFTDQALAIRASPLGIGNYIFDTSYAKLRTVSLRVDLPREWLAPFGAQGVAFSLIGNNLMTWTSYLGADPEINEAGQANATRADFFTLPPARSVTATVSVTF